jgi:hypothetical protein
MVEYDDVIDDRAHATNVKDSIYRMCKNTFSKEMCQMEQSVIQEHALGLMVLASAYWLICLVDTCQVRSQPFINNTEKCHYKDNLPPEKGSTVNSSNNAYITTP